MPNSELQLVRTDCDVPRFGLSIREAARSIGLSEGAFRELLPTIPHIRAGRRVIVPVDGFKAWLEQRPRQVASSEA